MDKRSTVAIAHSDAHLGTPSKYARQQLDRVNPMIWQVALRTMGGIGNIVKRGDKVLIKINTVTPVPADADSPA